MIPKFRVWDKRKKKFIRLSALHIEESGENVGLVYDMSEHYISTAFNVGGGRRLNLRDGVLMQSTGLKDKNGVGIFEGDVVLLNVNNGFDYVDNEAFIVQKSLYHSGLVCADPRSEMEYRIFNKDSVGGYSYEVIGNIHENPELLKEDTTHG